MDVLQSVIIFKISYWAKKRKIISKRLTSLSLLVGVFAHPSMYGMYIYSCMDVNWLGPGFVGPEKKWVEDALWDPPRMASVYGKKVGKKGRRAV